MFAGYNKEKEDGTLTGNWQEELALKGVTGYNRGPRPNDPAFGKNCAKRLIDHTDRVDPADYKSTTHADFLNLNDQKAFAPVKMEGPREARRAAAFAALVRAEMDSEDEDKELAKRSGLYETLSSTSFTVPPRAAYATKTYARKTANLAAPPPPAAAAAAQSKDDDLPSPAAAAYDPDAKTVHFDKEPPVFNDEATTYWHEVKGDEPFGRKADLTTPVERA